MVPIGCDFSKLRKTKASSFISRFIFGCCLTLIVTLTGKWGGAVIGGLFLAFPGIFPPGISYVEKMETERKQEAGLHGIKNARALTSLHAAGASEGTFGLMAFAAIVWLGLPRFGLAPSLAVATVAWFAVSFMAWWLRERM
ncbi:MAG: hypothetical protein ACRYFU_00595 [Janthinobacterium lividum]